jgi:hypothetical protein
MVHKFLTREQTYTQLLITVNESEGKIDVLKKVNEELRVDLGALTLDSSNSQDKAGTKSEGSSDTDIIMMKNELALVMKESNRLGERFKGINIVNDQISNWAKRIFSKFGVITQDPIFKQAPGDLVNQFQALE